MRNRSVVAAAGLMLLAAVGAPAGAQEWSPPSRQMPAMSTEGWQRGSGWFLPGTDLAAVRAQGEGGSRFIRFTAGVRPVSAWTDRNGDGRCDMVELYRGGSVAYQLLDVNYDGTADVLRTYDDAGALRREERL